MSAREELGRLDALLGAGLRLARSAPSGRVALARAYAALDPAWIPRPWGETLISELRAAYEAACEPLSMREVERLLREAWGCAPADELDALHAEPVAVTPGVQVHRGVLDGRDVAVKVLRPGLAASVRQDLALLDGLLSPLRSAFPAMDVSAVLSEVRERVLDELDLEHEAMVQRQFHRRLRGHPWLSVPAPVTRLCHEAVLVSEWIAGVPLWDAADPDLACARLLVFVVGAGRSVGYVHADPVPDDALVDQSGRVWVVDFGAVRKVQSERVASMCELVEAFVDGSVQRAGAVVERLGWLPASLAPRADELARFVLGPFAQADPAMLDTEAVIAGRDRLFERPDALIELLLAGALAPEDLWPLRGVAQLFGTIARVGASGRWRDLTRDALRHGWAAELDG